MEALAFQQPEVIVEQESPERIQGRYDITTQFSELVDGSMLTSFELVFDGNKLRGLDGRYIDEVSEAALEEAEEMAKEDPDLAFEVRRRKLEKEEIAIANRMARGEGPNTMVILSDFPEELQNAEEDLGGYNVTRKQAMDRILVRKPNGNIQMYSQSLDGSNRQALEAVYGYFGMTPEPGELLGQRIRADLPEEEQEVLIDRLTGVYDNEMNAQFGGKWYAGRRPADYRNTYDFVCAQEDIVEACIDMKLSGELTPAKMYDYAATMQKRFKTEKDGTVTSIVPRLQTVNRAVLDREAKLAGQEAREAGETFSACGVTLKAMGIDGSTEGQLANAGYGNTSGSKAPKIIRCIECGEKSPREEVVHKDSWSCPHCKYEVDVCTGKVLHDSEQSGLAKVIDLEKKRRAKEAARLAEIVQPKEGEMAEVVEFPLPSPEAPASAQ